MISTVAFPVRREGSSFLIANHNLGLKLPARNSLLKRHPTSSTRQAINLNFAPYSVFSFIPTSAQQKVQHHDSFDSLW